VATGDDIQAPVVQRADVAENIAVEGSAVLVLVGEEDDMTNDVEYQVAAPVQTDEGCGKARDIDSGVAAHVQVSFDAGGGAGQVQYKGGSAVKAPVDEGDDTTKQIDNGSDDNPVQEGADMTKNATSVDEADVAKDDEGGEGVHVQVYYVRVKVELAK
jgi:hypothetical protein